MLHVLNDFRLSTDILYVAYCSLQTLLSLSKLAALAADDSPDSVHNNVDSK